VRVVIAAALVAEVAGNLRTGSYEALQTSLRAAAPVQAMQQQAQTYAAGQSAAEAQEQQYVQEQQQFAQSQEQQFDDRAAPQPALQQWGLQEPGEVVQPSLAPAPVAAPTAAPWPATSYNTGQPLVTKETEEDARKWVSLPPCCACERSMRTASMPRKRHRRADVEPANASSQRISGGSGGSVVTST